MTGEGRKRRRETGIVHSRVLKWGGMWEERTEAIMGGRVDVSVAPLARQVEIREAVAEAERVRVRRWEVMGRVIGAPVHKSSCSLDGLGGGTGRE